MSVIHSVLLTTHFFSIQGIRIVPSLVFDTHQAVKNLRGAGADEKLAEVMVTTICTAITDQVATKTDLEHLKKDLTIRLGFMLFAGLAAMATFISTLAGLL